jgi:hypothetical protein
MSALIDQMREMGYGKLREIPNRGLCGVFRFLFTVGVVYGIDEVGYKGRYCFDTALNAGLFLEDWDGITLPVVGIDGCTALKGDS